MTGRTQVKNFVIWYAECRFNAGLVALGLGAIGTLAFAWSNAAKAK